MNSNYGKSTKSGSINTFDFDLGLNSTRSRPLNDQKTQTQPNPPYRQSGKPSWTHQPAPNPATRAGSLTGPSSMVGDISGKSWTSTTPSSSGIGIPNKNPNLFSDLLGPALGQNKGINNNSTNVPLKNSTPIKNAYSMGNMADSLPEKNNSRNWGSSQSLGGYNNSNVNVGSNKSVNLGGPSMKSSSSGIGGGMGSNKDPFGSLVDFGSKPAVSKVNNKTSTAADIGFGDFQNASKSTTNTTPLSSNIGSHSKLDDFRTPAQSSNFDSFDSLFAPSISVGGAEKEFSGDDEWDKEFGGGNDVGGTTELEGLPPPPSGVTGTSAKNKGVDNKNQGQYPDAIKWLSWAVLLFDKGGDKAGAMEVLSCRASCYKEVGEYKKAVADCTKVLEHDDSNVSVLVQRALLYESMEKYKLGAEDLRTVMKLDPGNRVARSTIHRLTKMADL